MKHHLNTLFITTEGAYLAKDGQAVAVKKDKQVLLRVPLHNLDGIVCFDRVGFSSQLAAACAENNITLSLLSEHGSFRAAVVGFSPGNVLLRRQQYRCADDAVRTAKVARNIVAAKIANSRSVLLRGARDAKDRGVATELRKIADQMSPGLRLMRSCDDTDKIRGFEGEAANRYFGIFDRLIRPDATEFRFTGRSRRPPLDPINALLSFLYA